MRPKSEGRGRPGTGFARPVDRRLGPSLTASNRSNKLPKISNAFSPINPSISCIDLPRNSFERRTGGGVEFAGHAAGYVRLASCEDGVLHGFGHEDGIGGGGDGGVHED